MRAAIVGAAAILIAGAYVYARRETESAGDETEYGSATAGDDEANFLDDGISMAAGQISGWPSGSEPYQARIEAAALMHGVPASILAWLLWKECRYNQEIISGAKRSSVGAMGIAQFMPATAREELGSEAAALDPSIAIPGAARYLKKLFSQTGTWAQALAAYNWGIGNVKSKGLSRAPAETRDYYTTILANANASGSTYA